MKLKDILKESTEASDIIKDLDKVRTDLIKKVDVLIAKKKKLYSDVDITTPMSADEKQLDKDIQSIFSQIQQIIQQKRKIVKESMITEKQFKGMEGIPPTTSLEKISKDQKLKIIKAPGNIIDFIVPKGVSRNFWQVIGTGKIQKNSGGSYVLLGKVIHSPAFKSMDDLIDGVNWKSMEDRRRFNESIAESTEIKWQDVEVGDAANVKAINKTGLIIKTYGRKFHLKFPNGSTKTYDANELTFVKNESINEGKYYIGYNKGRGQGTGVFKDVFSTYKDAKKELEKIEKQRGGSYHQIAYYVADENGNFVREAMLGEGRGIKSIQNDLDKTVAAIESEIASYKATKGTPQEKKHIDNLKKLHPIKKKLQSELDMAVSGLYRDAELKIED